jgi:hypothetical protein
MSHHGQKLPFQVACQFSTKLPFAGVSRGTSSPHYCLEARLLAQGIHERVGYQPRQVRIPQPQRLLQPLERFGRIAPLPKPVE